MIRYRSVWTSDHRLGNSLSDDKAFLRFLASMETDILGLVGDFIDGWSLKRRWYWPQTHNDVIHKGRKGTEIILTPRNHDDFLEFLLNLVLGHITIQHEYVYTAADGKRYLILHGHQFDVHIPIWLMQVGSWAYDMTVWWNHVVHKIGDFFHLPHWSLSTYLKERVKNAVTYMREFEEMAVEYARTKGCNGVICGHIHKPVIKTINGLTYINCGDWLEHRTAIVENEDGSFELIATPRTA